jgi:hypothetical protein
VNVQDNEGMTPLMRVCLLGHSDDTVAIIRELIEVEADVDVTNLQGLTAFGLVRDIEVHIGLVEALNDYEPEHELAEAWRSMAAEEKERRQEEIAKRIEEDRLEQEELVRKFREKADREEKEATERLQKEKEERAAKRAAAAAAIAAAQDAEEKARAEAEAAALASSESDTDSSYYSSEEEEEVPPPPTGLAGAAHDAQVAVAAGVRNCRTACSGWM